MQMRTYGPLSAEEFLTLLSRRVALLTEDEPGGEMSLGEFLQEQAAGLGELGPEIARDLEAVEFHFENHYLSYQPAGSLREMAPYHPLIGLHAQGDFVFLGGAAGGDWETPVFFLVYWDGARFRAYIPERGNVWNRETQQAFGNDPEEDQAFVEAQFGADREAGRALDWMLDVEAIRTEIGEAFRPSGTPGVERDRVSLEAQVREAVERALQSGEEAPQGLGERLVMGVLAALLLPEGERHLAFPDLKARLEVDVRNLVCRAVQPPQGP